MQLQASDDDTRPTEPIRKGDPCIIVIFGASGDLTKRKLAPALYNLAREGFLPDELAVIGYARRELDSAAFRDQMRGEVAEHAEGKLDPEAWRWLEERLYYQRGDLESGAHFAELERFLTELEARHQTQGNILFYLATAPDLFAPVVRQLEARKLTTEGQRSWRRVIVEKPFGRDLVSARELNQELRRALEERQIYRIDHYLGKETVQNLLVFRFSNGIFEPIWNRRYVDHVQITVAETLGVEGRGGYYDRSGALRDMVPNHIFQLISLVAMEPPISFEADAVRDEQSKVLRAVNPMSPEQVLRNAVRGQYAAGRASGRAAARLPARAPGRSALQHRDLRGHEARHRQLALEGRSLLSPGGQGAAPPALRDHGAVPAASLFALPKHPHRQARAQPAGDQRAAG